MWFANILFFCILQACKALIPLGNENNEVIISDEEEPQDVENTENTTDDIVMNYEPVTSDCQVISEPVPKVQEQSRTQAKPMSECDICNRRIPIAQLQVNGHAWQSVYRNDYYFFHLFFLSGPHCHPFHHFMEQRVYRVQIGLSHPSLVRQTQPCSSWHNHPLGDPSVSQRQASKQKEGRGQVLFVQWYWEQGHEVKRLNR